MQTQINEILTYWFEHQHEHWPSETYFVKWFMSKGKYDQEIKHKFGPLIEEALASKLDHWANEQASSLALILLTDQMTRSAMRGSADAFAGDKIALRTAKLGIDAGFDKDLIFAKRIFYYLPFEHSENLAAQKESVRLFEELRTDFSVYAQQMSQSLDEVYAHYQLIEKFGRFPHRNSILGRTNTAAEEEYLQTNANNYGQGASTK